MMNDETKFHALEYKYKVQKDEAYAERTCTFEKGKYLLADRQAHHFFKTRFWATLFFISITICQKSQMCLPTIILSFHCNNICLHLETTLSRARYLSILPRI